jgi:hypothetical protein
MCFFKRRFSPAPCTILQAVNGIYRQRTRRQRDNRRSGILCNSLRKRPAPHAPNLASFLCRAKMSAPAPDLIRVDRFIFGPSPPESRFYLGRRAAGNPYPVAKRPKGCFRRSIFAVFVWVCGPQPRARVKAKNKSAGPPPETALPLDLGAIRLRCGRRKQRAFNRRKSN